MAVATYDGFGTSVAARWRGGTATIASGWHGVRRRAVRAVAMVAVAVAAAVAGAAYDIVRYNSYIETVGHPYLQLALVARPAAARPTGAT